MMVFCEEAQEQARLPKQQEKTRVFIPAEPVEEEPEE